MFPIFLFSSGQNQLTPTASPPVWEVGIYESMGLIFEKRHKTVSTWKLWHIYFLPLTRIIKIRDAPKS